jgi:hypothetical protein
MESGTPMMATAVFAETTANFVRGFGGKPWRKDTEA